MITWGILQAVLTDNFSTLIRSFYQTDCWAIYYITDNVCHVVLFQLANILLTHITTLSQLQHISSQIITYEALPIYIFNCPNLATRLPPLCDYDILQHKQSYFPTLHFYLAEIITNYKSANLLTYFCPAQNTTITTQETNLIHNIWAQQQITQLFTYFNSDDNINMLAEKISQYQRLLRQVKEGYITPTIANYFNITNSNIWVGEKGKTLYHNLLSLHDQLHSINDDNVIVDINDLTTLCANSKNTSSPTSPTMLRVSSADICEPSNNSTTLYNNNGKHHIIVTNPYIISQGGNNYTIQQLDRDNQLLLLQYLQNNNLFPIVQQEIVNILGSK